MYVTKLFGNMFKSHILVLECKEAEEAEAEEEAEGEAEEAEQNLEIAF